METMKTKWAGRRYGFRRGNRWGTYSALLVLLALATATPGTAAPELVEKQDLPTRLIQAFLGADVIHESIEWRGDANADCIRTEFFRKGPLAGLRAWGMGAPGDVYCAVTDGDSLVGKVGDGRWITTDGAAALNRYRAPFLDAARLLWRLWGEHASAPPDMRTTFGLSLDEEQVRVDLRTEAGGRPSWLSPEFLGSGTLRAATGGKVIELTTPRFIASLRLSDGMLVSLKSKVFPKSRASLVTNSWSEDEWVSRIHGLIAQCRSDGEHLSLLGLGDSGMSYLLDLMFTPDSDLAEHCDRAWLLGTLCASVDMQSDPRPPEEWGLRQGMQSVASTGESGGASGASAPDDLVSEICDRIQPRLQESVKKGAARLGWSKEQHDLFLSTVEYAYRVCLSARLRARD